MTFKYGNLKQTVSQPIVGRSKEMSKTNGGGFAFTVDDFTKLDRFLNLGATTGTFYLSAKAQQYSSFDAVVNCINEDGMRTINRIVEVSSKGLAHKNDHAIYALALVFKHGSVEVKNAAKDNFCKVVRTGTHLFMFVDFIKKMRGFGKLVRNAINSWYESKDTKSMAFQVSKYQNREGWSHKDVFRLAHPKFGKTTNKNKIAKWAMGGLNALDSKAADEGIKLLQGVELVRKATTEKEVVKLITQYGLQREHIPTQFLNKDAVQEAMLPYMGATALIRNLGNMSASGLLSQFSGASKAVIAKLEDRDWLKAGRIHPLTILVAQRIYAQGRGMLGSNTWNVNNNILEALESAFYSSFDLITPTGKNFMYGIDVSGSMSSRFNDTPLSYCEVAAVLAMAHVRTEKYVDVKGFASNLVDLGITKNDSLKSASDKCKKNNFGSTNPSALIAAAGSNVDCFIVITDNEVNCGSHVSTQLSNYRKSAANKNAKMVVCGLAVNNFSIADPKDPNMLDIAGFSPDLTTVITNFVQTA